MKFFIKMVYKNIIPKQMYFLSHIHIRENNKQLGFTLIF